MNDLSADDGFRAFAVELETAISRHGGMSANDEDRLDLQRQQFMHLVKLENEFRHRLIASRHCRDVYQAFVKRIIEENGNVLTARPFFRERQSVCIQGISKALKRIVENAEAGEETQLEGLYPFHFNYNFIALALKFPCWEPDREFHRLAREIAKVRLDLTVLNTPLAISQARIFWSKSPARNGEFRFSFMDFVQIAIDGLLSAIDKFVAPENPTLEEIRVWRAVSIGRMRGLFIEVNSSTQLHFYPQDRRKIYRANKHLREFKDGPIDYEALAEMVNKDLLREDGRASLTTTATELAALMSAAVHVGPGHARQKESDTEERATLLDQAAAATEWQPDHRVETSELHAVLGESIAKGLTVFERKFLLLKSGRFDTL